VVCTGDVLFGGALRERQYLESLVGVSRLLLLRRGDQRVLGGLTFR
jgi:hypothetical protein